MKIINTKAAAIALFIMAEATMAHANPTFRTIPSNTNQMNQVKATESLSLDFNMSGHVLEPS